MRATSPIAGRQRALGATTAAILGAALLLVVATTARATHPPGQEADFRTIQAAIFPGAAQGFLMYREIARALIDQRDLNTVGPADEAADAFAIMMLTKPNHVPEIDFGFAATRLYWLRAREASDNGTRDEARARRDRVMCLWVGADPAAREHVGRADGMTRHEVYACAEVNRRGAATWRGRWAVRRSRTYPSAARVRSNTQ